MDTSERGGHRRLWPILTGLMLAMALAQLDQNIVAPALPQITRELGGLAHFAWIVAAFMLSSTISMPLYGRLGDLYGRKHLLLIALGIFVTGSLLCAAATGMAGLICARALQGLGAGGIVTQVQASIADVVPPPQRAHYQSLFMSVFAACGIGGPALGGLITQTLSWRWIFLFNLPIGAAAIAVLACTLTNRPSGSGQRIDYRGAVLLAVASSCLMWLLSWDWSAPRHTALGLAGALGFAALTVALVRAEKAIAQPLLPVQLLVPGPFLSALIVTICGALALFGAMVFLPLYFRNTIGVSSAQAGSMLIPFPAGLLLATVTGKQLTPRFMTSRTLLALGLVITLGANLAMGVLVHRGESALSIEIALTLVGLGNGLFMPGAIAMAQNAAPRAVLGIATATATFFRSLGGAIGVAVCGGVMSAYLRAGSLANTSASMHASPHFDALAYQSGLTAVFLLSTILIAVAFAVERLLPP